ncbi:MAG: ATP-binding protein [Myxococcota bacterium]
MATNLPRTVLSTATSEYRTLVGARREMMGWTQFQLEPSALRSPDPYGTPGRLSSGGGHLPATLHALARRAASTDPAEDICQQVANRLAELFQEVRSLRVDEDDKREQYSLVLTELDGTEHPASSLSDGTLRFLAMAVLQVGASGPSLLCLEEPENGIHPDRIPAMLDLLQDLAVDTTREVGLDNPLRQVIVNTHSPAVLREVPDDSIVVARAEVVTADRLVERRLDLSAIPNTWRTEAGARPSPMHAIYPYVAAPSKAARRDQLLGRADVQQLLLFDGNPS